MMKPTKINLYRSVMLTSHKFDHSVTPVRMFHHYLVNIWADHRIDKVAMSLTSFGQDHHVDRQDSTVQIRCFITLITLDSIIK